MIRRVLYVLVTAFLACSCGAVGESATSTDPHAPAPAATAQTTVANATPAPATTRGTPGPPSSTTVPGLHPVSPAEPLVLWAIGDSFLELFGPALVNRCDDTGLIEASVDFRYVSGLSRPDYFDWPAYIAEQLPVVNPDAVVVMFGGNDAQDVELGGERFNVGTDAWAELYAARVGEAMDVLRSGVERVYWIGLPIMKSDGFTANAQTMNRAYQAGAEARPGVTYISSFELFQDDDGEYSAYLDGKLMRFTDGAHFVWNGAYRLADAVLPVVASDWDIELS